MEPLTINTDISSFYPHILRKIHAQKLELARYVVYEPWRNGNIFLLQIVIDTVL
jgi:hypothetical protein